MIFSSVCNERRNSDLRANDPDIMRAINERFTVLETERDEAVKRIAALEHALHLVAMLLSGHGSSYHKDGFGFDCMTIHQVTPEAFHKVRIAVSSAIDPV